MKMIICSDQNIEIGTEGIGELYSPYTKKYTLGNFKFIRAATREEYYQYIAKFNLSSKGLRNTNFYYEIETDAIIL